MVKSDVFLHFDWMWWYLGPSVLNAVKFDAVISVLVTRIGNVGPNFLQANKQDFFGGIPNGPFCCLF
jgi:hypothetical protein